VQGGKLRHRVTVQAPTTSTDPFQTSGAGSWNTVGTVWARVATASTQDIYNAGLIGMKISHIVTIRYPGSLFTVAGGYQLLFNGRVFEVQKGIVNEDERNRQLQLYVQESNPIQ
jgi:SPP1 family predicted phage head-tail adaptor